MSVRKNLPPSEDQIDAVIRFASRNGRFWKSELRRQWGAGLEFVKNGSRDGLLLHRLRNFYGPSWLDRFSLQEAKAAVARAKATGGAS